MHFGKYASVIFASTIKFVGGPLTGATLGLTWLETALCTTLGMMLSVVVVTYAGVALQSLLNRYRSQRPKRFTRRTRMAVRIWKRSGMIGIALLTPLLLTPIGGTAIAVSFRVNRGQLLLYMLISGVFWAVLQTLLIYQIPGIKGFFAH
ncbi:hypothetical protein HNV11_22245 [Spirosoma taeanense]|uniref:Small multi-drug export protein n=1 Tax=Spirosoma taeanense TaxID=2735870 RepID=A0A6M5YCX5_9BACT|nr:hypothetical protein [Spirosoma taeanense]QJW91907.1 hypothetical protein HNV11_22245 [Spirosoma taeanense]